MYCPQCGTESSTGQQYCRSCGANLKVIGKAVSLSEAIGRSDRGPLPKIKEMIKNFKVEQVTEEVSRAFDQVNKEIVRSSDEKKRHEPWWLEHRKEKTPAQRRGRHIVGGTISLFSGMGLMIFLYYLTAALVLKLPPDVIAKIPFELDPVVHVLWLVGLIPAFSGLGRIIAGLSIRSAPRQLELPPPDERQPGDDERIGVSSPDRAPWPPATQTPISVTEHTTNILNHTVSTRGTNEMRD